MTTIDPRFTTVLADPDGFCRWTARLDNFDLDGAAVDLLIVLWEDGTVELATRPAKQPSCSWSPPIIAVRR
jgi:hypothetical protein